MPWWWSRLAWRFRRRRLVRLHMDVPDGTPATIEGVRLGVWGGHYVLMLAKLLESAERTIPLDGLVEIPKSRVLFVQVLPS